MKVVFTIQSMGTKIILPTGILFTWHKTFIKRLDRFLPGLEKFSMTFLNLKYATEFLFLIDYLS